MFRAVVVILGVAAILALALLRQFAAASVVGIVLGVIYLVLGLSQNNGLVNASLRKDPARPNDPNAGISMGLGAAGIASTAIANPHYPAGFHLFYEICFAAGLVIALTLSIRYRNAPPRIAQMESVDTPPGPGTAD